MRSLGLAAGVSHDTAAAVLRYLREQPDPFVVLLEPAAGMRGDRYELRIPDRWLRSAYRAGWVGGAVPVPHPVFRARGRLGGGLGLAAGAVYAALSGWARPGPRQLGAAARVGAGASAAGPPRRARVGRAGARAGGAAATSTRTGSPTGSASASTWPCWPPATAPTGPPTTRCVAGSRTGDGRPRRADPTTGFDVPVGPDPLADAAIDAAVALIRYALGGVVVEDLAA